MWTVKTEVCSHVMRTVPIDMYVYTGMCLLCDIHFHSNATDVLLCTIFLLHSCKDLLVFAVLWQNHAIHANSANKTIVSVSSQ